MTDILTTDEQQVTYANVETALVEALPELQSAYAQYLRMEGLPGEHPGSYIVFEQVFACYIEILLAMPSSPGRDRLLQRAFNFAERMLRSEFSNLRDLAFISLYEGREPWWYARALPFLSSISRAELDASEPTWCETEGLESQLQPKREIYDLYGCRDVVLRELAGECLDIASIPGISSPGSSEIPTLGATAKEGMLQGSEG